MDDIQPINKNEAAFLRFIEKQPGTVDLFVSFAFQMLSANRKSIGAPAVWERMRWEYLVNPELAGEEFKASNNHRAYMARHVAKLHPEVFGDFFATRTQTHGTKPAKKVKKAPTKAKTAPVLITPPKATVMQFSDLVASKKAKTAKTDANLAAHLAAEKAQAAAAEAQKAAAEAAALVADQAPAEVVTP